MKTLLILLSMTFILSPLTHAKTLADYVGCYKTLKINGEIPLYGNEPERTLSTIESGESLSFRNLDRERLDHVIINLYLGSTGNWHSYHPFVLFPEMGATQFERGILTHQMDEDLIFYDNYRPTRVDHYIDLKVEGLQGEKIRGYVSYRSNSRDLQSKKSFLLQKTLCP